MKKTTKKKRNPTPAQLRARAKFVKMVRARAAAKRKANPDSKGITRAQKRFTQAKVRKHKEIGRYILSLRAKGYSNSDIVKAVWNRYGFNVSIQQNQFTIHGIKGDKETASLSITNPRKKALKGATPKQERQYEAIKKSVRKSGRSLKESKRIAAATVRKRASNKTIIKAKRVKILATNPKRKRNPKVSPKSKQNFERFHGRPSRKTRILSAPDGTPKSLAITGPLHKLITRKVVVPFYKMRKRNPGGQVFLAESDNGGLHIVAEGMGLPIGPPNTDFGAIEKVEYDMPDGKPHLGYQEPTGFVHKFGEEGGQKPHLETNEKGEYLITGGDYYITERGIENPGRRRTKRRIYR